MDPSALAYDGPLLLAAGVALLAGIISFASPCVVPLVPGYLAYLAALVGADAPPVTVPAKDGTGATTTVAEKPVTEKPVTRWRVVGAVGLFVLGFTVVFVGTIGSIVWLADALFVNQDLLQRIGGVVTIGMALVFVGLVPWLQRDVRVHRVPRLGLAGAPLLGAVFGLGWTPCLGPTLSSVMAMALGSGGTAVRGYALTLVYCVGLGLPFLVIALGARWTVRTSGWLRRNSRTIQLVGGVLLFVVGVLLVTGLWGELTSWLRITFIRDTELPL
ncbi:cytochrome c biogenesis CcdA family protein [Actinophytocola gossypii]|uniref:Cytochrome c biogenesis protein CcdA n=1 Tax=Actinophytocola gossypii TaxID=2812003 RepID=A0ABT2JEF6_9PSEU|nr:cytochrome c biogenesis CcdA family protein [Actinophytocola gossypii]MCT2585654.1 cytochrome c biogenesis protein CcdA [Actinophytocola gossypii]